MAADTAATWCAKYELGDVLIDVPYRVLTGQTHAQFRCNNNSLQNALLNRRTVIPYLRDASCETAQQAGRGPSCLFGLFGLAAPQPTCAARIVPARAEKAGRSWSKVVPTCGQLASAAPHQVHRRRRRPRRRHR